MTERSCWYLLWDWGSSAPGVAPGVVLLAIVAPGVVLLAVVAPGVVLLAVVPEVDTDGAVPILALVWKKKKNQEKLHELPSHNWPTDYI